MINLFISDLHLDENRPDITAIFLKFLKNEAKNAQALYILGDFFEVWIGDDDFSLFNQSIIKGLAAATQAGLSIYLQHGNRDFLLGKKFLKASGCQLLPDEYRIVLGSTPTLLMHGDTLCTQDINYLNFRKKSRRWLFQKLFLLKSLQQRKAIAQRYREASKQHTSTTADYIMDVTQSEVERVMKIHQVQQLIHGHTHRPAEHQFTLNNLPATRIVLEPWHEQGNVLRYDSNGHKEWMVLR